MHNTNPTEKIYDNNAKLWSRKKANSLSDFTARPEILKLFEKKIENKSLLDLGCGEGYCARLLLKQKPKKIIGIDISKKMVNLANKQKKANCVSSFFHGDVTNIRLKSNSFDFVYGIFVYNYLTVAKMKKSFAEVFRVLKKGGEFIFSIPHPAFPFIKKNKKPPFYFNFNKSGYFSSRNTRNHGYIFCRDGTKLPVQMVHKLIEDYFNGLQFAGFKNLPELHELKVLEKHLKLDHSFFDSVKDIPLHMAIRIKK